MSIKKRHHFLCGGVGFPNFIKTEISEPPMIILFHRKLLTESFEVISLPDFEFLNCRVSFFSFWLQNILKIKVPDRLRLGQSLRFSIVFEV